MKWKKLGKIFDPAGHKLPHGCKEFAQSPQPLVFDDFVRIYFSTRVKDEKGKYLSHVAFVDLSLDLQKTLRVASEEVIPLGKLGCFDEHGIFPMQVLRAGNEIWGYTTGWSRRVSVSNDASIGHAVSRDGGLTFNKTGDGPVLSSSLHEPFQVADAFVMAVDSSYYMWYICGKEWIIDPSEKEPQRVYKIVGARSADGIHWQKEGRFLIKDKLNAHECQALPTVIRLGNKYHMYFCYREAAGFRTVKGNGYRIGYAWSDNMQDWIRDDNKAGISPTEGDWDSDMQCYPHVFNCGGKVYLLYNGNEFGRHGFGAAVLEGNP